MNLGRNYSELFKHRQAIEYYKIALELSMDNGNIRNMITCYNNIGTSYVSMGQFNKGVSNLEKGLKKIGFTDNETNGILGNNWFNFYNNI